MAKMAGSVTPVRWGDLYLMFLNLGRYAEANYCLDHILKLDSAA